MRFKIQDLRFKTHDIGLKYIVVIFLLALYCQITESQEWDTSRLSLVFAGDVMGHDEQITGAWEPSNKTYNYEPTFRYVRSFIEQADIAICNLEVTLAGPPYKGYPQFSSPDDLAKAAREAGFDVFIQANNHALDRGPSGFKRTLHVLDSLHIIHAGTYTDPQSSYRNHPLILEKNNIRIALLNYTYGTNGIAIVKPYIINRIDTMQIKRDLEKARQAGPDFIIVTIHWGDEYERFESSMQQKLAGMIFRNGANAIIGSHPHVVQPIRSFSGADSPDQRIVIYSMGNFVSNQRAQYKDGGILAELRLIKATGKTVLEHFTYLPTWVYRDDLPGKSTFYVVPVSLYENNPLLFNFKDHDRYKITQFAEDTREHLKNVKESQFFEKGNNDIANGN